MIKSEGGGKYTARSKTGKKLSKKVSKKKAQKRLKQVEYYKNKR